MSGRLAQSYAVVRVLRLQPIGMLIAKSRGRGMYLTNLGRVRIRSFALVCCVSILIGSTTTSFADVTFEKVSGTYQVKISGTISRGDAAQIAQRETELARGDFNPKFDLNSRGGDVDAAIQRGRIIRRSDVFTFVEHDAKCFSSCALIFIAGVNRIVDWDNNSSGLIGL